MPRPVIALLTDFGVRDHYVGAMKGVILGICSDAALVDICHDVPPHDVAAGACELAAAYECFPQETIFLVVVDPGVGSARRGVAAEAGSFRFVAPDNGVLSAVFERSAPRRIVELSNPRYARAEVSRTFEGRDRFAPAAAWLAAGVDLARFGPEVESVLRLELPTPALVSGGIDGEVVRIDRFGNLITNIDRQAFELVQASGGIAVHVGDQLLRAIVPTYSAVAPGGLCALFGSSNHLEIAANGSSAATRLGLGRGAVVRIRAC